MVSRLEDQGVNKTSTSRQEHRDAREGHQSTAPAHDRRHEERAQIRQSVWITLHSLARIFLTIDISCLNRKLFRSSRQNDGRVCDLTTPYKFLPTILR